MTKNLMAATLLAAGAAATGCSEIRMGEPKYDKRMPHWRLAMMSYTFRNFSVFEAIDKTKALDLKYLEEFSWHKVGGPCGDARFNETASTEVRQAIKDKLKESGVKIVGCYVQAIGKDEAASRRTFEFCKDMGIEYIVCEPDPRDLDLVDKLAGEYKVHVAIHNHWKDANKPDYRNWNPDEVLKMVQNRSKWIGLCADTGHWARSGLDTVEAIRKCRGRIVSLHLKDVEKPDPKAHDVVWGTGVANLSGVLAELAHQKFRGVFSIEYEANPDNNTAEVAQCIKFFNQVSNELAR
ncbi:MAG: sugar phosphate isomerase/epimerase family protein [Phycisphaerae bacterium]